MGTISAGSISEALSRAQNIGIVEEPFTLLDCALVLRNLRPDEYGAVMQECMGLEDAEYLVAYQKGHLSRSIVEINGVDLRDVDLIEVQETDDAGARAVKLEKHTYLTKNLLSTWSKEAVFTAYRKFTDVVGKAEEKARQGVTFTVPDETPEQKYRRLLGDMKEIEGDVPADLVTQILEDTGLMKMSTAEELKAAMERTDQLAREQEEVEAKAKEEEAPVAAAPDPDTEQTPPTPAPEATPARQPMNRAPGQRAPDPHQTLQKALEARQQPATEQPAETAPEQPAEPSQAAPKPPPGGVQADKVAAERAAQIAALEQDAGTPMGATEGVSQTPVEVPELRAGSRSKVDPKELAKTIDRPPSAGINPRYKPPPRV